MKVKNKKIFKLQS